MLHQNMISLHNLFVIRKHTNNTSFTANNIQYQCFVLGQQPSNNLYDAHLLGILRILGVMHRVCTVYLNKHIHYKSTIINYLQNN